MKQLGIKQQIYRHDGCYWLAYVGVDGTPKQARIHAASRAVAQALLADVVAAVERQRARAHGAQQAGSGVDFFEQPKGAN